MQLKLVIFRNGLQAWIGIWNASSLILSLGVTFSCQVQVKTYYLTFKKTFFSNQPYLFCFPISLWGFRVNCLDTVTDNKQYTFYRFVGVFFLLRVVQSEMEKDHCKYKLVTDDILSLSSKRFYLRKWWGSATYWEWLRMVFCNGFCVGKVSFL